MAIAGKIIGKVLKGALKASKSKGKKAADLSTPSSVATPGSGKELRGATSANEGSVRSSQVASKKAKGYDDAAKNTKKELNKQKEKLEDLKIKLKAYGKMGNPPLKEQINSLTEMIDLNTAKLYGRKGMIPRGGPRVERKAGGSLKDMPAGNKGLPNLPTATRNKMGFKKAGGMVKKMDGGKIYKRGHGGKVIKASRSGQDLVNSCYD